MSGGLAIPLRFIRAAWSLLLLSGDLKIEFLEAGIVTEGVTTTPKLQNSKDGFQVLKGGDPFEETLTIGTSLQRMVIHRKFLSERPGWVFLGSV